MKPTKIHYSLYRCLIKQSLLPGPKTLFLDRYYFHPRVCVCVCVCLCVCVWVCISIISKSSWPILMKLGRMMYNENISVPFKDEINWFGRTHTLAIWDVKIVLSYKVLEKHITSLGPLKLSIPFKNCTYIYYILLLHVTKVYIFFFKNIHFFNL